MTFDSGVRARLHAEQTEISDPRAMRALAHPARLAILGHLQRHSPATATQIAAVIDESPSNTSYHLRALARWGLVEPAEGGRGRERPWRTPVLGYRFAVGADDSDERLAAAQALRTAMLEQEIAILRAFARRGTAGDPEWDRAALVTYSTVCATPDELVELGERVNELITPLLHRNRPVPPVGAIDVRFSAFGVPLTGSRG